MKKLHARSWVLRVLMLPLLLDGAACATATPPSPGLQAVGQALQSAKGQGASHSAPAKLHEAEAAYLIAERCEQARGQMRCADDIYLALRRAQLAQAHAALAYAHDTRAAAQRSQAQVERRAP